jgi:hypothetical protein
MWWKDSVGIFNLKKQGEHLVLINAGGGGGIWWHMETERNMVKKHWESKFSERNIGKYLEISILVERNPEGIVFSGVNQWRNSN